MFERVRDTEDDEITELAEPNQKCQLITSHIVLFEARYGVLKIARIEFRLVFNVILIKVDNNEYASNVPSY